MCIWQRIKAQWHRSTSLEVHEAVSSEETETRPAGRDRWPGDIDAKPARYQQVGVL